jgi:hypothetical protein
MSIRAVYCCQSDLASIHQPSHPASGPASFLHLGFGNRVYGGCDFVPSCKISERCADHCVIANRLRMRLITLEGRELKQLDDGIGNTLVSLESNSNSQCHHTRTLVWEQLHDGIGNTLV